MLSAIVTWLTGDTIAAYLTPRLFEPLGMGGLQWDIGPDGVKPGGNGISIRPADALKPGILHAHNGVWPGRPVQPPARGEAATHAHSTPAPAHHWVVGDGVFCALRTCAQ